ncbi:low molecular weight phosphatase family protein [Intrasporangium calvum]|uniref:Low molecular weight phosphatase family protein n=1 Tax=Intrasporangium calvum TaxID=53358 RepID=A0ABT5GHF6_9MICO|nr:low molecular weight phosphatase family protein [Intrasporangium calvum]MDC5697693.1 low molecular weight phosphatase family protein [Intrasporangium calvum]
MSEGDAGFRVLTVCTGNICRSPVAERLIRRDWADGSAGITVLSAGTEAMIDAPIHISMAHLLEQSGAYSGEFCARLLTPQIIGSADLVLGMTRRHRTAAVALVPAATGRTFTLREFARLSVDVASELGPGADRLQSLRRLTELAGTRRRAVLDPRLDDIADPYGRELDAYHVAFDEITEAVDVVARVLDGEPVSALRPVSLSPEAMEGRRGRLGWRRRRS